VEPLSAPPRIRVPRLSETQRIVSIPPVPLLRAQDGASPRLRTALRVAVRGGSLVARFDGRDDGWVATKTRRDDALWEEDVFEVYLTPVDATHTYYEFEVNPLGTLFDAAILSPGLARPTICVDVLWDCPGYRARVRRAPGSWSAALTIPLEPLCADGKPPRESRSNFFCGGPRELTEYSSWSPLHRDPPDFHDASRFGTLVLDEAGPTAAGRPRSAG